MASEISIFSVAKHYSGMNVQPALGHSNYKNIRGVLQAVINAIGNISFTAYPLPSLRIQEICPNHAGAHFLAFIHLEATTHFTCPCTSQLTLPAQSNAGTAGCRTAHFASCMIAPNLLIHSTSQSPLLPQKKTNGKKLRHSVFSIHCCR